VHKRGQIAPLTLSDVVSAGMCNICRHGARLELPLPGTMGVLMKLLKGLTQRPITGISSVLGRLMATSVVGGPRYGKATPRGGSFYPARAFSSDPLRKNLRSLAPLAAPSRRRSGPIGRPSGHWEPAPATMACPRPHGGNPTAVDQGLADHPVERAATGMSWGDKHRTL
jgi:hypothetical protein